MDRSRDGAERRVDGAAFREAYVQQGTALETVQEAFRALGIREAATVTLEDSYDGEGNNFVALLNFCKHEGKWQVTISHGIDPECQDDLVETPLANSPAWLRAKAIPTLRELKNELRKKGREQIQLIEELTALAEEFAAETFAEVGDD